MQALKTTTCLPAVTACRFTNRRIAAFLTFLSVSAFVFIKPVHAQDNWPVPTVALYDCNTTLASTNNESETNAINSISKFIFEDIVSDSSSHQVFLFSFGFADTTNDTTLAGASFPFPDTGAPAVVDYDFLIASKVVWASGIYTLTISIEDGHTYTHVADGTATFGSATDDSVRSACNAATRQILPLAAKIRDYLESLKSADPMMVIDPQVDVSTTRLVLPTGGSTGITITVKDCDGLPVPNRQLSLKTTRGVLPSSTVETDQFGVATAFFDAGDTDGVALLTATLQDSTFALRDTVKAYGEATVIIGNPDTTSTWILDFDVHRSLTSYQDQTTSDADTRTWTQSNKFVVQRAHGRILCSSGNSSHTSFIFNDSTLSVSGTHLAHSFSKFTSTDMTGNSCPKKYREMGGTSQTYEALADSDVQVDADVQYDPVGWQSFSIMVPYITVDFYSYDWQETGVWENGQCQTGSSSYSNHQKLNLDFSGGITLWGTAPVEGLSIVPRYTGSIITGYAIQVDETSTSYDSSNGSSIVYTNLCTASLEPLSSVTAVRAYKSPGKFYMTQNYPNPFNPSTIISYQLPTKSHVTLEVYDVLGREVRTLANEDEEAGTHEVEFIAGILPSGVYFYRLDGIGTDGKVFISVKKFMLLK